jgi:hypothetical protein
MPEPLEAILSQIMDQDMNLTMADVRRRIFAACYAIVPFDEYREALGAGLDADDAWAVFRADCREAFEIDGTVPGEATK